MTITTLKKRTIFDALIFEPLDLVTAQPPQIFISLASGYLIGAEAAVLLPFPFNVLLAAGAEWGYLRGLASAAGVETAWKERLTYANGALVVLYGALFSLRKFGALPAVEAYQSGAVQTTLVGAIVMTLIHIACIGAVTICAMMAHAALMSYESSVKRKSEEEVAARNRAQLENEDARRRMRQEAEDRLFIQMREEEAKLRLMEETERRKMQLRAAQAQLRSATREQVAAQPQRNQKIIYDGVEYPSIQAAADAHGITRQAMSKRLRNQKGS